jgi:hypothetical protein
VLRPLISFVVSWPQSMIECNAETKQLYPTHLKQESIAHRYFWEGGQARFPAMFSSPHSHILDGVHIRRSRRPVNEFDVGLQTAILEHENYNGRGCLAGNGLYLRDIAFVQRAALHSAKCADTEGCADDVLYDGTLQALHGRSSSNSEQTHDHCVRR